MTAKAAAGFAGRMEPPSRQTSLDDLDRLADLLDTRWRIPGTNWRFGVDAIASIVPVAGDLSTAVVSAYMIKRAHDLGAPNHILARMVGNVAIDTVVGSVPLIGTVFDFAFKANRRNMTLLKKHFAGR
ncbi:hypothetical protein JOD31_002807 [Methylopila capsulata]|uniref:DUF4112 domain-containing protein n=1 Tax=Methylopila capsulata TaxID=61654 RepID=A0A9W6MT11_9HYPH|nr:DUF4112 domain-containing protein [Methylopila capsulata]MBM7852565.1 hypothetical protein [Methylopila capsulata]GLK56772.1 hypothetical protein GCM10008170_27910 [Methylopila capsulata]